MTKKEDDSLESILKINLGIAEKIITDIKNIKKDICKIVDKLDELSQTDINLKYLIEKNGKVL